MSQPKKIYTETADKKRLLEALKKLQLDGVRIIDDRNGRAQVIPAVSDSADSGRRSDSPVFQELEAIFDLEDQVGTDPYNKIR